MKKVKHAYFPLLLVLYEISLYLVMDAYLPALPAVQKAFMTTASLIQLTLTLVMLGNCSSQLILGPLCDRFGRRPILFAGGAVFVLATVVCAIAPTITILLIARYIQGLCIPTMLIAGYAVIHESFEQAEAIKKLAWMGSVTILAPAFGPLLGSLLLYLLEWRGIFALIAVLSTVLLISLFYAMPETLTQEKRQPLHLMNALKQYGRIITTPAFIFRMLALGGVFATLLTWVCASPLLVISKFHYSVIAYGCFATLVFCGFIAGMRVVSWKLQSVGPQRLMQVGFTILLVGGLLLVSSVLLFPTNLISAIMTLMIMAIGCGLVFPILNRLTIESSTEPMGARMAIFASMLGLFGALGSIAATIDAGSFTALAGSMFGFVIFAVVMYGVVVRGERRRG